MRSGGAECSVYLVLPSTPSFKPEQQCSNSRKEPGGGQSKGSGDLGRPFIIVCNKFIDFAEVLTSPFVSDCVLFHTTFANYWWILDYRTEEFIIHYRLSVQCLGNLVFAAVVISSSSLWSLWQSSEACEQS